MRFAAATGFCGFESVSAGCARARCSRRALPRKSSNSASALAMLMSVFHESADTPCCRDSRRRCSRMRSAATASAGRERSISAAATLFARPTDSGLRRHPARQQRSARALSPLPCKTDPMARRSSASAAPQFRIAAASRASSPSGPDRPSSPRTSAWIAASLAGRHPAPRSSRPAPPAATAARTSTSSAPAPRGRDWRCPRAMVGGLHPPAVTRSPPSPGSP